MPQRCIFLFWLCLASLTAFSQDKFVEGRDYEVVPVPFEANPDELPIVVTEVFSYACPHCYDIEELLEKWITQQDPEKVKFERIHVVFNMDMVNLARAYLTSETLDVTNEIHLPIFSAIHKNGLRMNREDLLMRLFKNKGDIEFDQFKEVFDSPEITQKMRDNNGKARVWRIVATPTVVVDGRYTTTPSQVNSKRKVFDVVDFLVQKVLDERADNSS